MPVIQSVADWSSPDHCPHPGAMLGLANSIAVYAVYRYRPGEGLLIGFVRVFLGALFGAVMSALIYSLAGSVFCLAGMLLLRKVIEEKYIWLSSVFGAVLHNIGQITAAVLVTQTAGVLAYLPFLLVSGCLAGAFTGICAQLILRRLSGKRIV